MGDLRDLLKRDKKARVPERAPDKYEPEFPDPVVSYDYEIRQRADLLSFHHHCCVQEISKKYLPVRRFCAACHVQMASFHPSLHHRIEFITQQKHEKNQVTAGGSMSAIFTPGDIVILGTAYFRLISSILFIHPRMTLPIR